MQMGKALVVFCRQTFPGKAQLRTGGLGSAEYRCCLVLNKTDFCNSPGSAVLCYAIRGRYSPSLHRHTNAPAVVFWGITLFEGVLGFALLHVCFRLNMDSSGFGGSVPVLVVFRFGVWCVCAITNCAYWLFGLRSYNVDHLSRRVKFWRRGSRWVMEGGAGPILVGPRQMGGYASI